MVSEENGLDSRFEKAWSMIVEFFPDALLVVRVPGGMQWRDTNPEWAHGAAERFRKMVLASDISSRGD